MNTGDDAAKKELLKLYSAYKQLSSAFAAGVILESEDSGLLEQVERLRLMSDQAAVKYTDQLLAPAFQSCVVALEGLCDVLRQGSEWSVPADSLIEWMRRLHHSFRRQIWQVSTCEYVPCSVKAWSGARGGAAESDVF